MVGIFWVVVGDFGYFLGGGGWWWVVVDSLVGGGTVYNNPKTIRNYRLNYHLINWPYNFHNFQNCPGKLLLGRKFLSASKDIRQCKKKQIKFTS